MPQQLVIFDMDGVLVDTEPMYRHMNKQFLSKYNACIPDDEYDQFIGIAAHKMWTYLLEKYHLPFSADELIYLEKENKAHLLQTSAIQVIDGIIPLLESLKAKNIKLALASSSMRKNIILILTKTKLLSNFDFILSGDEVKNGKPNPEIFLKSMLHFGLQSKDCIVIEDSENGVKAANAASIFVVGFQSEHSGVQNLSTADLCITDFSEVNRQQILNKLK